MTAWTIGKVFGIPVRLHVTMVLVPFLTFNWMPIKDVAGVFIWASLVVLLFGSVLLHELGHAIMARRFGVHTQDIVLTPLGGMARVLRMTIDPKQEIAIAMAGPIVSLTLAGLAFLSRIPLFLLPILPLAVYDAMVLLFWINLMLGFFNLVPALPMDGGRVLRGILALKRDHLAATIIAARVGRVFAGIGIALAIYESNFSLGIISIFVFLAAGGEVRMAQMMAYQERMKENPFAQGAGAPPPSGPGRGWTSTWTAGRPSFGAGQQTPPSRAGYAARPTVSPDEEWSDEVIDKRRDIVVVSGKAEIIGRKDPDSKD